MLTNPTATAQQNCSVHKTPCPTIFHYRQLQLLPSITMSIKKIVEIPSSKEPRRTAK
jgi:hypothetical protein